MSAEKLLETVFSDIGLTYRNNEAYSSPVNREFSNLYINTLLEEGHLERFAQALCLDAASVLLLKARISNILDSSPDKRQEFLCNLTPEIINRLQERNYQILHNVLFLFKNADTHTIQFITSEFVPFLNSHLDVVKEITDNITKPQLIFDSILKKHNYSTSKLPFLQFINMICSPCPQESEDMELKTLKNTIFTQLKDKGCVEDVISSILDRNSEPRHFAKNLLECCTSEFINNVLEGLQEKECMATLIENLKNEEDNFSSKIIVSAINKSSKDTAISFSKIFISKLGREFKDKAFVGNIHNILQDCLDEDRKIFIRNNHYTILNGIQNSCIRIILKRAPVEWLEEFIANCYKEQNTPRTNRNINPLGEYKNTRQNTLKAIPKKTKQTNRKNNCSTWQNYNLSTKASKNWGLCLKNHGL